MSDLIGAADLVRFEADLEENGVLTGEQGEALFRHLRALAVKREEAETERKARRSWADQAYELLTRVVDNEGHEVENVLDRMARDDAEFAQSGESPHPESDDDVCKEGCDCNSCLAKYLIEESDKLDGNGKAQEPVYEPVNYDAMLSPMSWEGEAPSRKGKR